MKKWIAVGLGLAVGLVGVATVYLIFLVPARPELTIGDARLNIRVARTDSEREQGLSGTKQLLESEGLLFVFPSDDTWAFWMKGMNYPIDIIWLDRNKTVVYVAPNVQPSSYPNTTYKPPAPARYVLETKSGVAEHKRITIGSKAVFDTRKGTYK